MSARLLERLQELHTNGLHCTTTAFARIYPGLDCTRKRLSVAPYAAMARSLR